MRLTVPASSTYLLVVRQAVSAFASRCGLLLDDIEDIRIAVDELTTFLLTIDAAVGDMVVECSVQDGRLVTEGHRETARPSGDLTPPVLSQALLAAASQAWSLSNGDGTVRFSVTKNLPMTLR